MKNALRIAAILLSVMLLLAGCAHKNVVDKEPLDVCFTPAHSQITYVPMLIGKNIIPMPHTYYYGERWDVLYLITYDDGSTAIVYMGHGTEHEYNKVYAQMQDVLTSLGAENYYVGTVEAEPALEDVMEAIADKGYTRVVLRPMMVVAGDHANNDMAGDEEDSWKSIFEAAGYEVTCVIEGLGQLEEVQQLFVQHTQAVLDLLG